MDIRPISPLQREPGARRRCDTRFPTRFRLPEWGLSLALAACLAASGCASTPYWVQTHEPLRPLPEIVVSASHWGPGVQGWIVRDLKAGTCQPFIVAGVDRECVLAHELRHCAGFDHPGYLRAFICNAAAVSLFPR